MRKLMIVSAAALSLAGSAMAQQAQPAPAPAPAPIQVPLELAQATVEYLTTRPYREVAAILGYWNKIAQDAKAAQPQEK